MGQVCIVPDDVAAIAKEVAASSASCQVIRGEWVLEVSSWQSQQCVLTAGSCSHLVPKGHADLPLHKVSARTMLPAQRILTGFSWNRLTAFGKSG